MKQRIDFKYIKENCRIETVLRDFNLDKRLKYYSDTIIGPCPLHARSDNKTAFHVSISKQLWRCFTKCSRGGDVIDMISVYFSISLYAAARKLACMYHLDNAFQYNIDYIKFLNNKSIRPSAAEKFEICYQYPDKIRIALHDITGNRLGCALRFLKPKTYKWLFPKGMKKSNLLYNFHRLPPYTCTVYLCECPWSVIRLAQIGIKSSVALLGTSISKIQFDLLLGFDNIVFLFDGDSAGIAAAQKYSVQFYKQNVFIIDLPQNYDPDDLNDHQLLKLIFENADKNKLPV